LRMAVKERVNRLKAVAEKMPESADDDGNDNIRNRKLEFHRNVDEVCNLFVGDLEMPSVHEHGDTFMEALAVQKREQDLDYITFIKHLPEKVKIEGTKWLQAIVDDHCQKAAGLLPAMRLFEKSGKYRKNTSG